MQVDSLIFSSPNYQSLSESQNRGGPIVEQFRSTFEWLLNALGCENIGSTFGFDLEKNYLSRIISKGMGYTALLLSSLVTYIGLSKDCSCGNYCFLSLWILLFAATRTNPKNYPALNLFLFIWGHLLLVAGNHCSYPATLSIVFILLTNL